MRPYIILEVRPILENWLILKVSRQYSREYFKFPWWHGDLCFYPNEWVCNHKCISKHDICHIQKEANITTSKISNDAKEEDDATCDWGLKRCGKRQCVSRYTPCQGKCWNEANPIPCGSNLCLNENQIRVSVN